MKTKEFNLSEFDLSKKIYFHNECGLAFTEKDIREFIEIIKEKIDNAQEDFGNLNWINKEHAINIINQYSGDRLIKEK